jgi:alanine racemase
MLTWVEIDTNALRRNIDALRSVLPRNTGMMVVVKGNAYGHGLEVVAEAAADHADWLGVNTLDEAITIRRLGIAKPVAILGHTELERLGAVVANDFRQVVYREDVAAGLSRCAQEQKRPVYIHLKIETGTHRQGIPMEELSGFLQQIGPLPNVEIEGVYTHLANIEDTLEPSFAQLQLAKFREAIATLNKTGIRPAYTHAAATAGALLYPEAGFTLVRVGIGAYGIWPSRETQIAARERGRRVSLTPALTWKTRVAQIKTIEAGSHVGYGLTFQATRRMKIAILPVGYFDGYDRRLSNCGRALVGGRVAAVIGRVAMNMTALDITDTDVGVDDEVVLIGRQGNLEIRVEELAEKIGTISYEVVSRINPAIPRIEAAS